MILFINGIIFSLVFKEYQKSEDLRNRVNSNSIVFLRSNPIEVIKGIACRIYIIK